MGVHFLLVSTSCSFSNLNQPASVSGSLPQIADGDGFVTQFILLNASGPSRTRLSFLGEIGTLRAVGK